LSDQPSALRSTLLVVSARVVSAGLTLTLGVLSAKAFGTSVQKDAFLVAQTIPATFVVFLIGGAYSTLFVTLAEIDRREGVRGMRRYLARILGTIVLVALVPILLVEAAPETFVRALAPGFPQDSLALAARLLQVTAVTALLGLVFSTSSSLFNVRALFGVPAYANLLPTSVTILFLLTAVPALGIQVMSLGPLVGTVLALVLLWLLTKRFLRDADDFVPAPRDAASARGDVRRFWIAFLPMSLGANFGQINVVVDNAFASFLPTGSITMLGFAYVIVANAQLLTTMTIAEVSFPSLTRSVVAQSTETRTLFRSQLRHMLMVTAPIGAGAFAFATPLVRALFERGAFAPEATLGVASLLRAYAPGVVFLGFLSLFSLFLTAQRRFGLIASVAAVMIGLNALLDWALIRFYGVEGIALGTSLTVLTHGLVLGSVVRRRLGGLEAAGDGRFLLKVLGAAAMMGATVAGASAAWEGAFGTEVPALRLVQVCGGLTLGIATYTTLLVALGVPEARDLARRLTGRFLPGRFRPED
jgi:putative peptidoglycan lipid II flippase